MKKIETQFISCEKISSQMYRLRCLRPEGFIMKPGQFINIMIDEKTFRSYSVSSHPSDPFIDCTIRFPEGSRARIFFISLKPGERITFFGAFGRYYYRDTPNEKVHIVTGAGIGPNYAMIKEWILAGAKQPTYLFYGVRNIDNLAYYNELLLWQKEYSLHLYPCISGEGAFSPECFSGRVLDVMRSVFNSEFNSIIYQNKDFYICGQPEMVRQSVDYLIANGVSLENIFHEAFNSVK